MKKVDIYSIQVSYTGTFESHSRDDWASKAQEMMEMQKRMHGLGCDRCLHRDENSPVCETIINHPEKFFACGFCCERSDEE